MADHARGRGDLRRASQPVRTADARVIDGVKRALTRHHRRPRAAPRRSDPRPRAAVALWRHAPAQQSRDPQVRPAIRVEGAARAVRRAGIPARGGRTQPVPDREVDRLVRVRAASLGSSISQKPFKLVVNIGAAEGYYVAGLAQRLPEARLVAWEADPMHARLTRAMAQHNGVAARVDVRGLCRIEDLCRDAERRSGAGRDRRRGRRGRAARSCARTGPREVRPCSSRSTRCTHPACADDCRTASPRRTRSRRSPIARATGTTTPVLRAAGRQSRA